MINEKYSYKSFKRQSLLSIPAKEFNNTEIIGSCFYQDEPYTNVFPSNITNVIFTGCNLDNCIIPEGATVTGGTNKYFKEQNDLEYWLVDNTGKILKPRDEKKFDECKLSKDPKDIPLAKLITPITITNDPKLIEQQKIEDLKNDEERLKQILIDTGELSESIKEVK